MTQEAQVSLYLQQTRHKQTNEKLKYKAIQQVCVVCVIKDTAIKGGNLDACVKRAPLAQLSCSDPFTQRPLRVGTYLTYQRQL